MTRNVESIFGAVVTAPHQIPYNYTATGGETFISLPFYPITGLITINSGVQVPLDNYNIDGNTINFGAPLDAGDVVYCLFDKILSPQDTESTLRVYKFNTGTGGQTEFTPDFTAYGVQTLYVDGKYQVPGVDYTYNGTTGKVAMTTALPANVWVSAEMTVKQSNSSLSGDDGASKMGTTNGNTVQEELNNNLLNDREQWRRSLAEAGLTLVAGSFEEGAIVNNKTDAVWYIAGGQCYVWDAAGTKTIPAKSTPASTGGISSGAWLSVGDAALRGDLSKPTGAELSGYGDVTVAERLSYVVYITNADPTGATSCIAAVQAAVDANKGKRLVLPAGNYLWDGTVFLPRNTTLSGVAPIPTMFHDMVHNNAIVDLIADDGYTKLHLKGDPDKRILTDVVHGVDDPAYSMGIVFAESGAGLENIAIIGWRKRTDGTYEAPSLTAANDPGAVPCFDIPVFNASVMSVRMHDTLVAGYIPQGSACYWIDASRGEQRNGSGNDFNVNDRIKSVGANDSRQIDCCFWWFHPTIPSTSDARNYYGVKIQGHDDDIRNLDRYPGTESSGGVGAGNWIWGGPGVSDHKFRGSVMKGVSIDNTVRSYVGDDRLNYFKTDIVGGVNGYPGAWQNLTGAGGKISFNDCVIRQGDININRAAYVWFDNTYGESGYFKMTNLTGYVTQSDGFLGHGAQDITVNNPDGTTPAAYSRLTSPLYKVINCGNQDRFGLFYTSGSNAYMRPHFDNKVSLGFDDGATRLRWSNVHTVTLIAAQITATTTNVVTFLKPPKIPSYTTANRPALGPGDLGSMILDTTLGYQICWTGSAWKNGVGAIV